MRSTVTATTPTALTHTSLVVVDRVTPLPTATPVSTLTAMLEIIPTGKPVLEFALISTDVAATKSRPVPAIKEILSAKIIFDTASTSKSTPPKAPNVLVPVDDTVDEMSILPDAAISAFKVTKAFCVVVDPSKAICVSFAANVTLVTSAILTPALNVICSAVKLRKPSKPASNPVIVIVSVPSPPFITIPKSVGSPVNPEKSKLIMSSPAPVSMTKSSVNVKPAATVVCVPFTESIILICCVLLLLLSSSTKTVIFWPLTFAV